MSRIRKNHKYEWSLILIPCFLRFSPRDSSCNLVKSWWWRWAGSTSAFSSEENKVTWPSATQPKTKNIIQYGWQRRRRGSAPTTTTIQPLATERTRGDAIYSDWAFEICMPHAARLQRRLLCVFSEDVTATGTRLEKKNNQKTTSHRCIFSVILLRHWHSSTW